MNENNANFTPAAPNFKTLVRMSFQGLTNFPYIEEDFDALTNYGLLSKVVEYLNQVISNNNEQNDLMTNLYNAYVSLQTYVNNYFDNLDVQDEINNKLDEMAQDGTLQEIIADYLNSKAVFGFDNVAAMKSSTNLINGSYAETLGYYSKNDGGSSLYKIRTITNDDIVNEENIIALSDNTLIAELVITNSEINTKQFGLYGDNTHDDTLKFQDLINYCEQNKFKLSISSGKYLISDELNVTGCNISGKGSKNSVLILNNTDGLLLKQYNSQDICVIENIGIKSTNVNNEIAGIKFYEYSDDNTRSRGYKITNCYFENLGCAIDINDCFRTTISDCGMIACYRALFIKRQTVQSTFKNITSNYDLTNQTSTRYGNRPIGVQIGIVGEPYRPEGIKLHNVSMTNHEVGLFVQDVLYCVIDACEFDYCRKEACIIISVEGDFTLSNSWCASHSTTSEPIIHIQTPSTTTRYRVNIINNLIGNVKGHVDKIGIGAGITQSEWFRWNINIDGNVIKNFKNSTPLKYGIYVNRCRHITINNNYSYDCTTDIYFIPDSKCKITNNITTTLEINTFEGIKLYAYANIYNTLLGARPAGTVIGSLD